LASKFINCLMHGGKKATAMRVFYGAMNQIKEAHADINPIESSRSRSRTSSRASSPLQARRRATYQVPMAVNKKRQQSLAIRWILGASRGKSGRPMFQRLADELMERIAVRARP